MKARIVLLPGDGVGPEVLRESRRVLERIAQVRNHDFQMTEALMGGAAIRTTGRSLPKETVSLCMEADAALLGAVGDPAFDGADVRPEQGLLELRGTFGLFANLRPIWLFPQTAELTPLRPEVLADVDILFVRELTGGIYFGPREEQGEGSQAHDTLLYTVEEVERIAHVAFKAARIRKKRLTSVDKANVLASSRLWRRTVDEVAESYPDVEVEHLFVDAFAMHILRRPSTFDVVLTGNMFGDILTDEASVLAGSLGMLPSASLGKERFGLFEPIHGSAPDIAGRGIANPMGTLLSTAMMLRHSLEMEAEAAAVEGAVATALARGFRTPDLGLGRGESTSTTAQVGDAVLSALEETLDISE
jgi:3-isopropylmalate dehydrogenase